MFPDWFPDTVPGFWGFCVVGNIDGQELAGGSRIGSRPLPDYWACITKAPQAISRTQLGGEPGEVLRIGSQAQFPYC